MHPALLVATAASLTLAGAMWAGSGEPDLDWPAMAVRGAGYAFWVLLILGAHEMGHYLACRYYGIPATLPFFIPGIWPIGSFGALIRIRGPIPHRRALFDVAAAGPIAGFVIALPVMLYGLTRSEVLSAPPEGQALYFGSPLALRLFQSLFVDGPHVNAGLPFIAGWVGMLVTSLNLFPVGQLDGGHAVYAFGARAHRWVARLTLVALAAGIVAESLAGRFPPYVLWFVILLVMRDRHPRLVDESGSLGIGRRLVALALLAIFVLSFIPVPLVVR